jgi:monomeric isocitrate dehydrogenase
MIWLDGNVPSLKNSKIKTSRGIFPSKTVKKYLQNIGIQKYSVREKIVKGYVTKPNKFGELTSDFKKAASNKKYPLKIGFHFVRNSKRSFDFHNAVQIIADLMVAHDFIEDDDMDHFIPVPLKIKGKYYSIDKERPGVYIKIY